MAVAVLLFSIAEICPMRVLVVSSTLYELANFNQVYPGANMFIHGVGISSSIFHLTRRLSSGQIDFVIQLGIAGSFGGVRPGEVVLVKRDCFADCGAMENGSFNNIFDLRLSDANQFPFQSGWLVNEDNCLNKFRLPVVDGITVNAIRTNEVENNIFLQKYRADIETMEGASLHYVCLNLGIRFLQMRAISNFVGDRDKNNWKINDALFNLTDAMKQVFETLNQ